jgi:hypothetical protein
LLNLALRKCAFSVASLILEVGTKAATEKREKLANTAGTTVGTNGLTYFKWPGTKIEAADDSSSGCNESLCLDPLVTNEAGEDAMDVLAIGFTDLGQRLRQLQADINHAGEVVVLSEEQNSLETRSVQGRAQLVALRTFSEAMMMCMQKRQLEIEADARKKRFNELRALPVSSELIWNISQLEKCVAYQGKCEELKTYIADSSNRLEECLRSHVSLAEVVARRHRAITQTPDLTADIVAEAIETSTNMRSKRAQKQRERKARNPVGKRKQQNNASNRSDAAAPVVEDVIKSGGADDVEDLLSLASVGNGAAVPSVIAESAVQQPERSQRASRRASQRRSSREISGGEDFETAKEMRSMKDGDKEKPADGDDTRLSLVYKVKSASESKRELYAKAGLKMETADDYAPILGTLYQSDLELIQYR